MTTTEAIALTGEHILSTYGRRKLAFASGSGVMLRDLEGREYADFTSGLGVNALGYAHPAIVDLITSHATGLIHTSNLYHIPAQAELARKLCSTCFGERVFFCNSGAEAVEGALKFTRKWGKQFDPAKTDIIACSNSFHGRTMGALSATMQRKYQNGFDPLVPGFVEIPYNDASALEAAITPRTAAIILEPLQGEGGVNAADPAYMTAVERICRERNILLIVDEVQCGMARTGVLHAHQRYGITPDLMALAKPLAGGLPIGAVVVGPRVWPVMKPGEHASTFGGSPFISAVANGVFDIISAPAFVKQVAETGGYFRSKLELLASSFPAITEVRGAGLLLGIRVTFPAAEAIDYCEAHGFLVCAAGPEVIRFIPPLIIGNDAIDQLIETLTRMFKERT